MPGKKGGESCPGNQVHAVVQIDMPRAGNPGQFLRFGGTMVGLLAELSGVRLIASDEQQRSRGNRLDIVEWIEIHEPDFAGQGAVLGQLQRSAMRDMDTAWRTVEVPEFTCDRVCIFTKLHWQIVEEMHLPGRELAVALLGGFDEHGLALLGSH